MTRVTNFVWIDDRFITRPDEIGRVDAAIARRLWGQFALHQVNGGEHVLVRDPLGVNKLFFAFSGGDVVSSSFWIELACAGHAAESIWSVPSGSLVRITPARRDFELASYAKLRFEQDAERDEPDADDVARIQRALARTFERLRAAVAGRPLYVTLSGGLDSTTIAVLARRHLGEFTAVTFAIRDGDDRPTEDLHYASRVAAELGVPLRVVYASADELLELVDVALACGQDWRDFNVHCALVNAAIGRDLGAGATVRPVLLTGDVMNELVADYTPVSYRGREHYALPALPARQLRRFLVQGLDAGDREVGVYAHYGIDVLQPYALCADAYAALPGGCVESPTAKQRLVRDVMGDAIPPYVYDRPKVRAQIGGAGEVRGTLAALLDRGVDAAWLERRFCALFGLERLQLRRMIRAGVYRFPTSYPDPFALVAS